MKKSSKPIVALCLGVAVIVLVVGCGNNRKNKNVNGEPQKVEQVKTPEELRVEQERREQELLKLQELERITQKLHAEEELKQRIDSEIKLLDEPFNTSSLSKYTVSEMNYLVEQFRTRAKMIREGENSDNTEIQELAKKLRTKAVAYQVKAFPILRKAYATGLNNELWAVDGKAYVSGNSNIYITVVSPELVQNKMKLEAHKTIYKTLLNVRFRQARYKYYDGSDYTYWTVFEGKDADLIE